MYSLPTEIHEDLVARPLFPPEKRDEKNLGVLGCKNPTVTITRTRSLPGVTPLRNGSVDSGHTLGEADAVQCSLFAQPVVTVGVNTCISSLTNKEKN